MHIVFLGCRNFTKTLRVNAQGKTIPCQLANGSVNVLENTSATTVTEKLFTADGSLFVSSSKRVIVVTIEKAKKLLDELSKVKDFDSEEMNELLKKHNAKMKKLNPKQYTQITDKHAAIVQFQFAVFLSNGSPLSNGSRRMRPMEEDEISIEGDPEYSSDGPTQLLLPFVSTKDIARSSQIDIINSQSQEENATKELVCTPIAVQRRNRIHNATKTNKIELKQETTENDAIRRESSHGLFMTDSDEIQVQNDVFAKQLLDSIEDEDDNNVSLNEDTAVQLPNVSCSQLSSSLKNISSISKENTTKPGKRNTTRKAENVSADVVSNASSVLKINPHMEFTGSINNSNSNAGNISHNSHNVSESEEQNTQMKTSTQIQTQTQSFTPTFLRSPPVVTILPGTKVNAKLTPQKAKRKTAMSSSPLSVKHPNQTQVSSPKKFPFSPEPTQVQCESQDSVVRVVCAPNGTNMSLRLNCGSVVNGSYRSFEQTKLTSNLTTAVGTPEKSDIPLPKNTTSYLTPSPKKNAEKVCTPKTNTSIALPFISPSTAYKIIARNHVFVNDCSPVHDNLNSFFEEVNEISSNSSKQSEFNSQMASEEQKAQINEILIANKPNIDSAILSLDFKDSDAEKMQPTPSSSNSLEIVASNSDTSSFSNKFSQLCTNPRNINQNGSFEHVQKTKKFQSQTQSYNKSNLSLSDRLNQNEIETQIIADETETKETNESQDNQEIQTENTTEKEEISDNPLEQTQNDNRRSDSDSEAVVKSTLEKSSTLLGKIKTLHDSFVCFDPSIEKSELQTSQNDSHVAIPEQVQQNNVELFSKHLSLIPKVNTEKLKASSTIAISPYSNEKNKPKTPKRANGRRKRIIFDDIDDESVERVEKRPKFGFFDREDLVVIVSTVKDSVEKETKQLATSSTLLQANSEPIIRQSQKTNKKASSKTRSLTSRKSQSRESSQTQTQLLSQSQTKNQTQTIRRLSSQIHSRHTVLLTGLSPSQTNFASNALRKLGGKLCGSHDIGHCTHVVADRILRTLKFIQALPHAPFYCTYDWIVKSFEKGEFLPEDEFFIDDKSAESLYDFSFAESIKSAKQSKVFADCTFYFLSPYYPPTPTIKEIKAIIKEAGGKISRVYPSKITEMTYLVINQQFDNENADYLRAQNQKDKLFDVQAIITAVLTQRKPLSV